MPNLDGETISTNSLIRRLIIVSDEHDVDYMFRKDKWVELNYKLKKYIGMINNLETLFQQKQYREEMLKIRPSKEKTLIRLLLVNLVKLNET